jgi:hydroxyquinol 1,2-dioxygenase
MHELKAPHITDAVLATMSKTDNPRLLEIMTSLIKHVHAFVREIQLKPEEWVQAIDFLTRVGEKTSPDRNEFILASDVLGVSSLVDLINQPEAPGASTSSLLGPFYTDGVRMETLEPGADLIGDNPGEPVLVLGQVTNTDGTPIPGAQLEVWQNASNGLYESEDPNQPEGNLRGKMHTDAGGYYRFTTTKPVAYTVPFDGPVGELLQATGRHAWRPAHIHFRLSAPGYEPLVTELFVAEDPYINEDAVFGVRESLVVPFKRLTTKEAASYDVQPGYCLVAYDFVLQPRR